MTSNYKSWIYFYRPLHVTKSGWILLRKFIRPESEKILSTIFETDSNEVSAKSLFCWVLQKWFHSKSKSDKHFHHLPKTIYQNRYLLSCVDNQQYLSFSLRMTFERIHIHIFIDICRYLVNESIFEMSSINVWKILHI